MIPVLLLLGCFYGQGLAAGDLETWTPSPKDKCPVCGMFVKKYPDWLSRIVFRDGSYAVFDGAKDMFRYYHDMARYSSRPQKDIASIHVTDYYSLEPIDGRKAFFVMGSDVYGPMGHELIPFQSQNHAKEFARDHKGKRILGFSDVTGALLKGLD